MPSQRRLTVVPALLLVLAGCGGADGDEGSRAERPDASYCDRLTTDEVERQTGVVNEVRTRSTGRFTTCVYTGDDGLLAATVQLSSADDTIDDLVETAIAGGRDEVTTEPLELDGAEEALIVRDTSYGLTTISAVARSSDAGVSVFGSGGNEAEEERVAVALLTVLLGGEADSAATEAVHPCDLLTGREVSRVVGRRATVERDGLDGAETPYCAYEGVDERVTLVGFGLSDSNDFLVDMDRDDGAEVTEIFPTGYDEAFLVRRVSYPGELKVYLAGPFGSYLLSVSSDSGDRSTQVAADLLARMTA